MRVMARSVSDVVSFFGEGVAIGGEGGGGSGVVERKNEDVEGGESGGGALAYETARTSSGGNGEDSELMERSGSESGGDGESEMGDEGVDALVQRTSSVGSAAQLPSRVGMLGKSTEKSYNVFRKKFASFCVVSFDAAQFLPKEVYTDRNIAGFLAHFGEECNYKVILV